MPLSVCLYYNIPQTYLIAYRRYKASGKRRGSPWSFMIAFHLFNLLFLRWKSTLMALVVTLICGWTVVAVIILIGPMVIQTAEKGPYFGVSGFWCWITNNYPHEQVFLEYFFVSHVPYAMYIVHMTYDSVGVLIRRHWFSPLCFCSSTCPR
jgi:hypothetical protein